MKTVAIVGFSTLSLPFIKLSKADEIWTLNHAYRVIGKYLPRIDRLFEMHSIDWFRRKEIKVAEEYWQWLTEPHDFPVYMQEVHPEIPSSVKYPKDEVLKNIFGNIYRGDEVVTYATSSVALMIALAIYEKVDRLELFGVEMQTGTEYEYQKACGEFMLGVAAGRGMEIQLVKDSYLLRGKLYGYSANPLISRKTIGDYHEYYKVEAEKALQDMVQARDAYNEYAVKPDRDNEETAKLFNAFNQKNGIAAAYAGAVGMSQYFLDTSDYWISRQNLEGQSAQYKLSLEKWKAETNYRRAVYNVYAAMPGKDPAIEREHWQKYTEANLNAYSLSGSLQVIEKFLKECDLQEVEMSLGNRIIWDMEAK